MLTQATSGWAVHWHSRSVLTSIAPDPPEAGTGVPGASTVTAHFDNVEGEVTVLPDEPQDVSASAAVRKAAFAPRMTDPRIAPALRIITERLCWPLLRGLTLQDARRRYQMVSATSTGHHPRI